MSGQLFLDKLPYLRGRYFLPDLYDAKFDEFVIEVQSKRFDEICPLFLRSSQKKFYGNLPKLSGNDHKQMKVLLTSVCMYAKHFKNVENGEDSLPNFCVNNPLFASISHGELKLLRNFIRGIELFSSIADPSRNLGICLDLCATFEEGGGRYTTGGKPSKATQRRVALFHHMTGVVRGVRRPREEVEENDHDNNIGDFVRIVRARNEQGGQLEPELLSEVGTFLREDMPIVRAQNEQVDQAAQFEFEAYLLEDLPLEPIEENFLLGHELLVDFDAEVFNEVGNWLNENELLISDEPTLEGA